MEITMAGDASKRTVGTLRDAGARTECPTLQLETDEKLFGEQGALDSLGLVEAVVAAKEEVRDEPGVRVALSDAHGVERQGGLDGTLVELLDFVDVIVRDSVVV